MKNLSSLIRNAVIATAMVLMPSAASAWYYCDLISSDGTVMATASADYTLNSYGNGYYFYLDLTNLNADNNFCFYFMAYTDKSSGLNSTSCVNFSPTWTTGNVELTSSYTIGETASSTTSVSAYWYISGGAGKYVTLSVIFYETDGVTFTASETATSGVTTYVDPTSAADSYWLYIPDIHGSTISACETESFKFSNERVREGGNVLNNYLSYNIQEFVLKNKLNVSANETYDLKFYIWDGTTLYGTWSSGDGYTDIRSCTYKKESSDSDWTTATGDWQLNYLGNVDSYLYSDCYEYTPSSDAVPSDAYAFMMTLYGDSASTTYKHQSVTLMLYTSSGPRLRACFNDSYFGLTSSDTYGRYDTSGYYLVGNFDAANADQDINPFSTDNKKTMTKYYYYDSGNYSTTEPTSYDSIVYKTTVTAPSEGFSGLYLVVFPKTFLDNFPEGSDETYTDEGTSGTITDNSSISYTRATIWYRAIRPQEEFYYTTPGKTTNEINGGYDGLDGTALHGGLYARQSSSITYDTQQAFNPSELENVTSLTFSMNVTTSTYNITMTSSTSDHIFIAGPAVGTVSNGSQVSGWTAVQGSTGENSSTDWAGVLELTYDSSDGCYKYLNSSNTEQKITMSQGKEFIFMRNNPTDYTMEENSVTPVDLSGTSDSNKEVSAYGKASTDIGDYDTQYVNYMETKENPYTATTFSSSPASPITFNLPDGSYYVRLYWGVDSAGVSKTFYTISPRSYTFYYPTTAVGLDNIDENTFKAFCDYHAVVIPHGMRAYYVTTVANTNATIEGSKAVVTGIATLDSITFGSNRVLPANTPVYLAEKDLSTTGSSSPSDNLTKITHTDIEYYGQPWYSDASLTSNNQLVGQITKATIPTTTTNSGTTYYNYMLGYKTATGDSKPVWGFYVPDQSTQCAINSVYLSTSTDVNSDATGAKFIALSFDGVDSETTTIEAVDAVQTVTTGDDAYYTLQGFKLTAVPTTKGIYIHNGKKVIIK